MANDDLAIPKPERLGEVFAQKVLRHIEQNDGNYLRDENGALHLILDRCRIQLNPTADNYQLAELMLKVCNVSTLSPAAKVAIQRIQVEAAQKASCIHLRRFFPMTVLDCTFRSKAVYFFE